MLLILFSLVYYLSVSSLLKKDESNIVCCSFNIKKKDIYTIALMILLIVMMGGTTSNPDFFNYKDIYVNNVPGMEIGYVGMMNLSRGLGLSYEMFRLSITLLGFVCLYFGLVNFKVNKLAFFSIYFLYPFPLDVIQIRNFLMMTLVFLALSIFISETNVKKKYIFFYLLVGIGFLIQKLAIVYFFFPFFLIMMQEKRYLAIYFKVLSLLSIIAMFPSVYINLLEKIFNLLNINNETILFYLGERKVRYGFLVFWLISILILLSTRIMGNIIKKSKFQRIESNIITNFIYFSVMFTPLYTIDLSFWRMIRNSLPIFIVFFLKNIMNDSDSWGINENKKRVFILAGSSLILILFFENRLFLKSTIYPMFFENWISLF